MPKRPKKYLLKEVETAMYENWEQLKADCMQCRKCGLCETRTNLVFGVGNENAKVLFIGEGPGANEDAQQTPPVKQFQAIPRICQFFPNRHSTHPFRFP